MSARDSILALKARMGESIIGRGEESDEKKAAAPSDTKLAQQVVFDARVEIFRVNVSTGVEQYIVSLVFATRNPDRYDPALAKWIHVGVSPRGGIGLDRVSRAYAWLGGRDYVTPDDVPGVVHDVFRHRVILSYEAHAEGIGAGQAIDTIVGKLAVA